MTGAKYGNETTVVAGQGFDSRREARRYQDLRLLERAGEITELERQPQFPIKVPVLDPDGSIRRLLVVAIYIADFRYHDRRAQAVVVEDAKGVRTPVYRLKKKLVEAQYGIRIVEV